MIYVNARFLTQPLTGVQRYAFEISMQMKKLNSDIVFLSPKNILHHEWAKSLGAITIGLFSGHLWEQFDLSLYLLRHKNSILFSPCNTGPCLIRNQVLTLHDIAFKLFPEQNSFWFSSFYNRLIPSLLKTVRHIFTVSETSKQQIMENYFLPESMISISYNGIGEGFLPERNKPVSSTEKEKIVLCVGSLSKRKNVDLLSKAFMKSNLPALGYTLILAGNESSIHQSVGIPKDVQIIVKRDLKDTDLIDLYRKAEISVCLSSYEGFGIPIMESLFFFCKVLCADIPVFRELYTGYVSFANISREEFVIDALNKIPQTNLMDDIKFIELLTKYNYHSSAKHILQQLQS